MNNRGGTLTNWIFVIALVLLMIFLVQSQILDPMNEIYNSSYQTGMNTSGLDDIQDLKETSHSEIEGAEVTQTDDGLSLKSAWTVGKATYSTIVGFVNGNFINNLLTNTLDFPPIVATILVVLIWISLILIIIYIFMKVIP